MKKIIAKARWKAPRKNQAPPQVHGAQGNQTQKTPQDALLRSFCALHDVNPPEHKPQAQRDWLDLL